jgi:D-alanyl-lipoteichoic acid acyltransferase DltB (MBOAT superfamily)
MPTAVEAVTFIYHTGILILIGEHLMQPNMPETAARPERSPWLTPEFLVYIAYLSLCYIFAVPEVMRMGEQVLPLIQRRLSVDQTPLARIFGDRFVDNSDAQYAGFRNHLPALFIAMGVYLAISWSIRSLSKQSNQVWRGFLLLHSLLFITVLHGPSGLVKILVLLAINYVIGQLTAQLNVHSSALITTWVFCIGVLFANDLYSGLSFRYIFPPLSFLDQDRYKGLVPRWYITFNITILRLISYNTDLFWSRHQHYTPQSPVTAAAADGSSISGRDKHKGVDLTSTVLTDRQRIQQPRPSSEYSFSNYLIYCLYSPLYLAGPIITFNDFMSQLQQPKRESTGWKQVLWYGLRLIICILLMETMMRLMWVVAMSKERVWDMLTPIQLALFSYFNLKFIWLKVRYYCEKCQMYLQYFISVIPSC